MQNKYSALLIVWLVVAGGCASFIDNSGTDAPGADVAGADRRVNDVGSSDTTSAWRSLSQQSQWRTYGQLSVDSRWQFNDGVVLLTARGGGDLITRDKFSDFELMLEWQISERGNSGIFFLADESELPIFVHAPEVQILDNERHPDGKQADRRAGSLYDMVAAPAASQLPSGSWNAVRIQHVQGQLKVWQNDVLTVDIHIGSAAWNELLESSKFAGWKGFAENSSGHIGLQDHGDRVAFRNIKIRSFQVPTDANPGVPQYLR